MPLKRNLLNTIHEDDHNAAQGTPHTPKRARHAVQENYSLTPGSTTPAGRLASSPLSSVYGSPVRRGPRRGIKAALRTVEKTVKRRQRLDPEAAEQNAILAALERARVEEEQRRQEEEAERAREHARELEKRNVIARDERALRLISMPVEEGGLGYASLPDFWLSMMDSRSQVVSSQISRLVIFHADEILARMMRRNGDLVNSVMLDLLADTIQHEATHLRKRFTRAQGSSTLDSLTNFTMTRLQACIAETAPTISRILSIISTRPKEAHPRRDPSLVHAMVCAMLINLQSERANEVQLAIGVFLVASGAAKREIAVLAHSGVSLSYDAILFHLKHLSAAQTERTIALVHTQMVAIQFDNINIAFKVHEQRVQHKSHFDDGTTGTVVALYTPETAADPILNGGVKNGTLPFSMATARTSRRLILPITPDMTLPSPEVSSQLVECCLWQIKRIAMDQIPGLDRLRGAVGEPPVIQQIPLHKTEHMPLRAMHIDESSLDGVRNVLDAIFSYLKMSSEDWKTHGLLFVDGDLLSDSLVDKLQAAGRNSPDPVEALLFVIRRFGLFHCKMSAARMFINEHWGIPNSEDPGSAWWMNQVLGRKPMIAGWKAKKAAEWKPAHELLLLTIAARVYDAFRICATCATATPAAQTDAALATWAETATIGDLDEVARSVFRTLFSSRKVQQLRHREADDRDVIHENAILFNRDVLFYVELASAIKRGDIGRVMNVLRVLGLSMRGTHAMPRYADAITETMARINTFPTHLRTLFTMNWLVNLSGNPDSFKEIDLLGEHQNFWAKIIYVARGVNSNWHWLGMMSVIIFVLCEILRTMQQTFKIPAYGTKHTSAKTTETVKQLSDALRDNKIQEYVRDRPGNVHTKEVRDLLLEGTRYANSAKAFSNFRPDTRVATNLGPQSHERADDDMDIDDALCMEGLPDDGAGAEAEGAGIDWGDIPATDEDIFDDEEFCDMADGIMNFATDILNHSD